MPIHVSSRMEVVAAEAPNEAPNKEQLDLSPGALVNLGSLMKPMKEIYPPVDADDGPMTDDGGIETGAGPATSGMKAHFINSSEFNKQSQNWITGPTGVNLNASAFSAAINVSTPRIWTFGFMTANQVESVIDTGWVTDATTISIIYLHYNGMSLSNYHDHRLYVEDDGKMKKLADLPEPSTVGAGVMWRTLTFKEAKMREFRLILPGNCWFIGVYVNLNATMKKAPNKFLAMIAGADSWSEAAGGVLASPVGGAWPTGTYKTDNMPQGLIEATGWGLIMGGQGGTGYFNVNDGVSHDNGYVDAAGTSAFMSQSRVDFYNAHFKAKRPLVLNIGGWNDGPLGGTPYRDHYSARVLDGIDRYLAIDPGIQMVFLGIQPVSITPGDSRDLSNLGISDAVAARSDNAQFISIIDMWADSSTGADSERTANTNATDTIHLTVKGGRTVGDYFAKKLSTIEIPRSYVNAMLAA